MRVEDLLLEEINDKRDYMNQLVYHRFEEYSESVSELFDNDPYIRYEISNASNLSDTLKIYSRVSKEYNKRIRILFRILDYLLK